MSPLPGCARRRHCVRMPALGTVPTVPPALSCSACTALPDAEKPFGSGASVSGLPIVAVPLQGDVWSAALAVQASWVVSP